MSRALWFVAGAGVGVYAMTKARRAAEVFTPEGLADRLAGLSLGAHLFGQEVKAGMAEKENEVRQRLGVADHGRPQIEGLDKLDHPGRELDHPGVAHGRHRKAND